MSMSDKEKVDITDSLSSLALHQPGDEIINIARAKIENSAVEFDKLAMEKAAKERKYPLIAELSYPRPDDLIKQFISASVPTIEEVKAGINYSSPTSSPSPFSPEDFTYSLDDIELTKSINDSSFPFSYNFSAIQLSDSSSSPASSLSSIQLSLPDSFDQSFLPKKKSKKPKESENNKVDAKFDTLSCSKCLIIKSNCDELLLEKTLKINELSEKNQSLSLKLLEVEKELEHKKKMILMSEDSKDLEIKNLESRCQRIQYLLEEELKKNHRNEDKVSNYDRLSTELNEMTKKASIQEGIINEKNESLTTYLNDLKEIKENNKILANEKNLLIYEKLNLETENKFLSTKNNELLKQLDIERSKFASLELKYAQLNDQFMTLTLTSKDNFSNKLDQELNRIKENTMNDYEEYKKLTKEFIEKENQYLKENKLLLENEVLSFKNQYFSTMNELNLLKNEFFQYKDDKLNELNEVKSELKIKTFENESLTSKLQDEKLMLSDLMVEKNLLNENLLAHKSAILKLETEYHNEVTRLKNIISDQDKKLEAYNTLEVEIDDAVLREAENSLEDEENSLLTDEERQKKRNEIKITNGILRGIPASPERRIGQAVYLAKRLLETQKVAEKLKNNYDEILKENKKIMEENKQIKIDLERFNHPTNYLVLKLREEENEKINIVKENNFLTKKIKLLINENNSLKTEKINLKERLKLILQQRNELESIKRMILQLQIMQEDEDNIEIESDSDDEKDENIAKNNKSIPTTPIKSTTKTSHEIGISPMKQLKKVYFNQAKSLGISPELLGHITTPPSKGFKKQKNKINDNTSSLQDDGRSSLVQLSYTRNSMNFD